jgi:glycosyltransferase involved in cell wall biosynthesis
MKIAVGLPAYNEEKNIAKIIAQLKQITDTIIVCNDGSSDSTSLVAENLGVIVVNHPKNLGYGASIRSLFLKGKEIDCDILVTFDADGQHDVKDIEKVTQPILNQEADIVIGSRFLNDDSSIPKYRKIGIKAITKITNASTGKGVTDSQSGFRAYSKKILEQITPLDSGMGVSTEILIKAVKSNFKIAEVPITVLYEGDTSTHHPVSHGISVIISTLKFVSIEHPLKFYGIPGIIFLTLGLFFILWTLQGFTDTRQVITNLALLGIGSTILGVMLLMTSIMLFSIVTVVRERRY